MGIADLNWGGWGEVLHPPPVKTGAEALRIEPHSPYDMVEGQHSLLTPHSSLYHAGMNPSLIEHQYSLSLG